MKTRFERRKRFWINWNNGSFVSSASAVVWVCRTMYMLYKSSSKKILYSFWRYARNFIRRAAMLMMMLQQHLSKRQCSSHSVQWGLLTLACLQQKVVRCRQMIRRRRVAMQFCWQELGSSFCFGCCSKAHCLFGWLYKKSVCMLV